MKAKILFLFAFWLAALFAASAKDTNPAAVSALLDRIGGAGTSARFVTEVDATLSADGNMYSRRGYGSSELNTDDFVLNASISQPFFNGKLIARIEAFDLLHQLSNTQYSVNAQGRTETWYRSLPHYVMAHLVYHWNRQSSKRKANLD